MAEKLDLDRLEKVRAAATQGKWSWTGGMNIVTAEWNGRACPLLKSARLAWHENSGCNAVECGHNLAFAATFDPPTIDQLITELSDARALEAATDTIIDGWRWQVGEERKLNRKLEAEVARLKASGIIGTGKREDPAGT